MNKIYVGFLVAVLLVSFGRIAQKVSNGYLKPKNSFSVIAIENSVIMGNTLPHTGVTCEETAVYVSPEEVGLPLSILSIHTTVRLHELSRGVQGWVMIEPAQWIKLSALCGAGE